MFSKKATKIDEIFTVDLTLCSKNQIHSEDCVNFLAFLENMKFTFDSFRASFGQKLSVRGACCSAAQTFRKPV